MKQELKKKIDPEWKSIKKNLKQIPKHLIYDDPNDNKSYLLGLTGYDKKFHKVTKKIWKNIKIDFLF